MQAQIGFPIIMGAADLAGVAGAPQFKQIEYTTGVYSKTYDLWHLLMQASH